jgi:hypothetical protein
LCTKIQEGSEQALYYDARIKEVERRRHDARGCRCRFLVQYDHDGVEVGYLHSLKCNLRKLCEPILCCHNSINFKLDVVEVLEITHSIFETAHSLCSRTEGQDE